MPDYRDFIKLHNEATKGASSEERANLERKGWYYEPSFGYSGAPSTQEEEHWILDFVQQNMRAPTAQEAQQWRSGEDTGEFHYSPESTMGKMGWGGLTFQDYRPYQNITAYGPGQGGLVPEEALLITDEEGNPIFRTNNPELSQPYVNAGHYYGNPSSGLTGGFPASDELLAEYYPEREKLEVPQWTEPKFEDMQPSYQLYQAQLSDYLRDAVKKDYMDIEEARTDYETSMAKLEKLYQTTQMSGEVYEQSKTRLIDRITEILSPLMTSVKAESILNQANEMVGLGMVFTELPLFNEVQGYTGNESLKVFQDYINQRKTEFQGLEQGYSKKLEDYEKRNIQHTGEVAATQGEFKEITGKIRAEFIDYIKGFSEPVTRWLRDNEYYLYYQWMDEGGDKEFMQWLREYLGK